MFYMEISLASSAVQINIGENYVLQCQYIVGV